MVIYGVALLAACMLVGKLIGEVIGIAIGVDSNVGGVGLAMLLLVFVVLFIQIRPQGVVAVKSRQLDA